jgi:hypothetical protein
VRYRPGLFARRRLKRGVFRSIADLRAAINRYAADHTHDPRPLTGPQTLNAFSPLSDVGTRL